MDSPPEALGGKKANGTKQALNESTGGKNFNIHSLKTLLTSEPQVAKPIRLQKGTSG